MAKYENIRALAKKQLQAVTESSDRWKAFLRTAAIAYNYSFPNQLLIHEQSPTATAVADIAYWNNNAGRWVKRGAHGIAVFDTRANSSRLRYLFDISDTIPRAEIPEALPWVITDQNWRPAWDKIVADNHADSIQSALLMLSTSCVAQRSAMFTTALGKAIDGSSLQWAKPDEQRQLFLQLITQSCLYMAALRCGVDTARLDLSALESVNQFDTNRITLCLGSACQQAARPLMQQIGSITREIDSVARAEKVRYYGDKQEETNNTKEVNNGVHDGERLPNPGADAERAADAGNREVRQPAAEIPAGERPDDVRRDDAGGNAVPASGGDFKGMELQIKHLPFGNEYHARLAGSGTYSTQLGADVLGNLTRLSNLANGIEPSIEKTRNMQIQLEQQLASAEEEVKRPFPQATELTEKSKRLAVLEGLLNMNDKDIVTDTEPEQQCQTDNRQRGQEER